MRRNVAQVLIAAAMADDIAGWILLGIVAGLAKSGSLDAGAARDHDRRARALPRRSRSRSASAASTRCCASCCVRGWGAPAHLTARAAGRARVGRGHPRARARGGVRRVHRGHRARAARASTTPTSFDPLDARHALVLRAALLRHRGPARRPGPAARSRGARLGRGRDRGRRASRRRAAPISARGSPRLPAREGLALGIGLNARGAVEIVVATVGLSLGVLNPASYALVVLLAVITSMMAPPLLRLVLRGWRGSEEEQARLARERQLGGNLLVRDSRVLLPSHGGPNSVLAARLVDLAWPEQAEVTVLSAGGDVPERGSRAREGGAREAPDDPPPRGGQGAAARDPRSRGPRLRRDRGRRHRREDRGHADLAGGRRAARVEPAAGDHGAPGPWALGRSTRRACGACSCPRSARCRAAPRSRSPTAWRAASTRACWSRTSSRCPRSRGRSRTAATLATCRAPTSPDTWSRRRWRSRASSGVRAEPAIRTGVSASEEILALAREKHVDLLVLAANLRQFTGPPVPRPRRRVPARGGATRPSSSSPRRRAGDRPRGVRSRPRAARSALGRRRAAHHHRPVEHEPIAHREQRRAEEDADEAEREHAADHAEEDQDERQRACPARSARA